MLNCLHYDVSYQPAFSMHCELDIEGLLHWKIFPLFDRVLSEALCPGQANQAGKECKHTNEALLPISLVHLF